jgi:hypothetical protein
MQGAAALCLKNKENSLKVAICTPSVAKSIDQIFFRDRIQIENLSSQLPKIKKVLVFPIHSLYLFLKLTNILLS